MEHLDQAGLYIGSRLGVASEKCAPIRLQSPKFSESFGTGSIGILGKQHERLPEVPLGHSRVRPPRANMVDDVVHKDFLPVAIEFDTDLRRPGRHADSGRAGGILHQEHRPHFARGPKAHQVLVEFAVGLGSRDGFEARTFARPVVADRIALEHGSPGVEEEAPVGELPAQDGSGSPARLGIPEGGVGEEAMADFVREDAQQRGVGQ